MTGCTRKYLQIGSEQTTLLALNPYSNHPPCCEVTMKRLIIALLGVLAVPAGVAAQSDMIESALASAPARGRDNTAVIQWNADYTYETLKEGTNNMVCYHRGPERGRPAFSVQCTSVANLPRVAQNRRFRADTEDRGSENAMIEAAEADGTRVAPEYGSLWISTNGDDQASAGTHTTVAIPGATTESTGFPENGRGGGAFIMGAGTSGAHLMTPGH